MPELLLYSPDRDNRVLAETLRVLFHTSMAISANFLVGSVAVIMLWRQFPHPVLLTWLAAMAIISGLRLYLQRRFSRTATEKSCSVCWAVRFTLGSFASGLLWAVASAGLLRWGALYDYAAMAVIATGLASGAVATNAVYKPAFYAYAVPVVLPLAISALINADRYTETFGIMLLIYFAVLVAAAARSHKLLKHTIELKVDNETLRVSLSQTRDERDEARKEKWSTLAQLSHELRTPLNAILGFSESMLHEVLGPLGSVRYKDYARHMHDSGQQLLTLADEMLLLSQGEAGQLSLNETVFDTGALISTLAELESGRIRKAGLTLEMSISSPLPQLRADRAKVRQILVNLLDNAIKFNLPGGHIRCQAECGGNGGVVFTIADTGIGIAPEDIAQVVQPFGRVASSLTHNAAGTGLGLAICKRLAELHDARLELDSTLGRGTVCRIHFPAERSIVPPHCVGVAAA